MAAAVSGWLLNSLSSTYRHAASYNFGLIGCLQARNYAARKGTREKARKKKVKVVVQKVGFIPRNVREAALAAKKNKNSKKEIIPRERESVPLDDVFFLNLYKWKIYSFEEAVQNHRELHHPTILNMPDACIRAFVELDMQGVKKSKLVNAFTRVANIPYPFVYCENRKILAFCKTEEMQELAMNAGAEIAGGKDLIKQIQGGKVSLRQYDVIISEPTMLPDLLLIRGLMKQNFPSIKLGTLHSDIKMLVKKFSNGIKYTATPHNLLKTYGTITVMFGTLDMDAKQLEENFAAVINDINTVKPRQSEPFITRIQLVCPPSPEIFKIEFEPYLTKNNVLPQKQEDVDEEEEEEEKGGTPDAVIASH